MPSETNNVVGKVFVNLHAWLASSVGTRLVVNLRTSAGRAMFNDIAV